MIEGIVRTNRARNERMANANSRWYILPKGLRKSFAENEQIRFNVTEKNPDGDRSGYASAIDIECGGWPIINPNDRQAILQAAIELTNREERRYQGRYYHRQTNTGQQLNITKSSGSNDKPSDSYITARRYVKGEAEWPDRPSITESHFIGIEHIVNELVRTYSPISNAYIMLGNSPAPIFEFIRRLPDTVCLSLPLSNVQVALSDLGQIDTRARMWAYLDLYISLNMLKSRTSVVIVDIAGSGNALIGTQIILDRYYINHLHSGIRVKAVRLNPGDTVAKLDTGGDQLESFGLKGLEPSSSEMQDAQSGILKQVFKGDYGYGMWNRTPMKSIFDLDNLVAGFDRDRYLTMIIDLLRAHGLKYFSRG